MTTSPVESDGRAARSRGFTLAEVLIAMGVGSIVMLGVLTTFVMLVRSSQRLGSYSEMEAQTRRAFEQLGIDARMATSFTTPSSGTVNYFTLTLPAYDPTTATWSSTTRTYGYYSSGNGKYTFYSIPGSSPATGASTETNRVDWVSNVTAISILRYNSSYTQITSSSNTGIKHLQISINVTRSSVGVADATQIIRSTAFTLRNM